MARPLYEIAADIRAHWKNVYFGAVPYLQAMEQLNSIDDMYGLDDARSIVRYFLSNASTWKKTKDMDDNIPKRIKEELRAML